MTDAEVESCFDPPEIPYIPKSPDDVFKWEKKTLKVVKCKLMDSVEGQFDLIEGILNGYALTQWKQYKHVKTLQ
eukprot:2795775-Ditylum_brightwellii.AAC.1